MGYPRKLTRRFHAFDNFAISFTIINIISGIFSAFGFGMGAGGPRILVFGWIGVSVMVLFVGAAMGEIASAYPTSGALYFSAGKLAKRHRGAWSWYTGWLNFVGQVGGTAATNYAAATFIQAFIAMQWPSYEGTPQQTVAIAAAILLVQALANTYTVQLVALVNRISVWWLLIGMVVIVVALTVKPALAPAGLVRDALRQQHRLRQRSVRRDARPARHQLDVHRLRRQLPHVRGDGEGHRQHAQGHHARDHLLGARRPGPHARPGVLDPRLREPRSPRRRRRCRSSSTRSARGTAKLLLLIVIGAMLFCGLANMTSNTRQIFAFSRDGAMPGSRWWHSVSLRTRTPVKAVWLAAACALVLIIPGWWSHTAFTAIVSVNVVGLYLAYGVPIFLRLRLDDFEPGPWNLGRYGKPVAAVAVVWIALSSVLFMLPQASPITADSFNYAPIALGVVLLIATVWWFATARRRFQGPVSYGSPDEVAAMDLI